MMRKVFTCASAVSLLPCVTAVALWVRSYRVGDLWYWSEADESSTWFLASSPGRVILITHWYCSRSPRTSGGQRRVRHEARPSLRGPEFDTTFAVNRLGFALHWPAPTLATAGGLTYPSGYERWVVVPHWLLVVVLLVPPGWWAVARVRGWRRRTAGLCRRCGYDLTGNVSGVCPECGTPVKNVARGEA